MDNLMSWVGFRKIIRRKIRVGQEEQMSSQVKKILGQKGQGLITMVRG
jgi:hypothetical protein